MSEAQRESDNRFYLAVGLYVFALGALGFARSFYLLPFGSEPLSDAGPIYPGSIAHGVVCTAWLALAVWQPWLIMRGNLALHRKNGLWGACVALALIITGLHVTWEQAIRFFETGQNAGFVIVPLGTLVLFAITFSLALHYRSRPQWHKRWIVVSHCTLLAPATARALATIGVPPLPLLILLISLPLWVGALRDVLRERKVPWIYLIGLFLVIIVGAIRQAMAGAPAWVSLVEAVLR